MRFVDLLKQKISLLTENDILKDIVFPNESAQRVLDMIKNKVDSRDILVVYVNDDAKVIEGVITDANVNSFLDRLEASDTPLTDLKVSDLEWDKCENIWLQKDETVHDYLKKVAQNSINTYIVVDQNGVYAGKIKRSNALRVVQSAINAG